MGLLEDIVAKQRELNDLVAQAVGGDGETDDDGDFNDASVLADLPDGATLDDEKADLDTTDPTLIHEALSLEDELADLLGDLEDTLDDGDDEADEAAPDDDEDPEMKRRQMALLGKTDDEGIEHKVATMAHEPLGKPGGRKNWVEKAGQLPAYIQHIAKDIHEEGGKDLSHAIAIAISAVKRWATGQGNVNADTRAKAAAAVAQWEALKAKSKIRKAGKAVARATEDATKAAGIDYEWFIQQDDEFKAAVLDDLAAGRPLEFEDVEDEPDLDALVALTDDEREALAALTDDEREALIAHYDEREALAALTDDEREALIAHYDEPVIEATELADEVVTDDEPAIEEKGFVALSEDELMRARRLALASD